MRWAIRGVGLLGGIFLIGNDRLEVGVLILTALALVTLAAERERFRRRSNPHDHFSRTYQTPPAETFTALRETVADLGYKITDEHQEASTLKFNTGRSAWSYAGQDFDASVRMADGGRSEISLAGRISPSGLGAIQSFSWGETGRLAAKVLDQVNARLGAARGRG